MDSQQSVQETMIILEERLRQLESMRDEANAAAKSFNKSAEIAAKAAQVFDEQVTALKVAKDAVGRFIENTSNPVPEYYVRASVDTVDMPRREWEKPVGF